MELNRIKLGENAIFRPYYGQKGILDVTNDRAGKDTRKVQYFAGDKYHGFVP